MIVAVYAVAGENDEGLPFHVTVPVNWASAVMLVTGVAPLTGGVIPAIAESVTVVAKDK